MHFVGWERITQGKSEGSLGVVDFQLQSSMLKLRFVLQLWAPHNSEWVALAKLSILQNLRSAPLRNETKHSSVAEFLLLLPSIPLTSRVLKTLLSSWLKVHPRPHLDFAVAEVPSTLTILELYLLSTKGQEFSLQDFCNMRVWAHSRGVKTVKDLWTSTGWISITDLNNRIRSSRQVGFATFSAAYQLLTRSRLPNMASLDLVPGWVWTQQGSKFSGWSHQMKTWQVLSAPQLSAVDILNRRWDVDWPAQTWQALWQRLWKGWGHPRTPFLIWRVLHFGFYTCT
jgi:hypothetical protein